MQTTPTDRPRDSDFIDYIDYLNYNIDHLVIDNCVRIHHQLTNISQVLLKTSRRLEEKR